MIRSNEDILTENWQELDRRHVWHPYTQMMTAPAPIPVEYAEGAYLVTPEGKRIIDAVSSWWVTLHGHAHPRIAEAIAEQAKKLEQVIFAGFTHEPASRLAAKLADILPGDINRIFYSDNGSTAVEVALKMCIQYWSNTGETRRTFIALEGAYHGDTFGAMSVSERSVFTAHFDALLFNVQRLPFPDPEMEGEAARMLSEARRLIANGDIAGVIVEPLLLGAGGMKMWRPEVLAELAELCHENGIPLIADEVLTGFGRTGTMFAVEQAEIVPDIICLSKGLTGGFLPFAVTACRDYLYEAFLDTDRSKTLFHGHSYTGNPLGCAAALAGLEIFEHEPVFERMAMIEQMHRRLLQKIGSIPAVTRTRVLGTVAAFDISTDDEGYLSAATGDLAVKAMEHGILLRPLGNVVYLLPPFCITETELEYIYDFIAGFFGD